MKVILILFITLNLFASIKQDMLHLYKNKKYEQACKIGFDNYLQNKKDESYISLYAFSCLNADYIDRLAKPLAMLKFSKEARANSAYFSVILMQKKLLYHAMIDKQDLSELKLPTTNYILSKVFDLYVNLGKHKAKTVYIFKDKNDNKISYKLYLKKDKALDKIVIEELYDTITIKRHVYW